jgi:hypothetical protein
MYMRRKLEEWRGRGALLPGRAPTTKESQKEKRGNGHSLRCARACAASSNQLHDEWRRKNDKEVREKKMIWCEQV